ncbi:unnamed protein product [Cuscuta campestris]|uniref:Uncharacterized protein n=1 Tax=Cuscuta campestris TaxID=132261 RepID=A0A484NGQ6_9ASTE|nr:unnamed protein product [Cuscuta campestris]
MASIDRCSVSVVCCCCCRTTERSTVALERSSTSTVSSAHRVIDATVDSSATAVHHSATAMADEQPRKMFFSLSSCVSSEAFRDSNYEARFANDKCILQDLYLKTEIGMGEQEGGLYYFKEPEKKMVCSAKKESASLDTGSTNEVSSYDEDEELRMEERMDRSKRDGRPEESGGADMLQTVDRMNRSVVHGRPSERQNDGFLRDDQTVDLVDRSDIHGRPSPRQKVSDPEQLQTVDPVDRSTDGGRPSSSQQAVENLGRGQREKRPNVHLADYVTHVAGSHVGEKCKYPLASFSGLSCSISSTLAMADKKALFRAKLAQRNQKRIENPLVRYNDHDQPVCRVCDVVLKSETDWTVHQTCRKHKMAIDNLKANSATLKQTINANVERPKDSHRAKLENLEGLHSKGTEPSMGLSKARQTSSLPPNFFDIKETKKQKSGHPFYGIISALHSVKSL